MKRTSTIQFLSLCIFGLSCMLLLLSACPAQGAETPWPAKYKKAYKAFLKDYGETGDGKTAEQDHLRSLDLLKMKDAATKFVRTKLREVKAR